MKNRLISLLATTVFLVLAIPAVTSAQVYRTYDDNRDYNRADRRDAREAISRLENTGARLESDLRSGSGRRVLGGLFYVRNVDNTAIAEVRDFRRAVQDLRQSARGANGLDRSVDEARDVISRGVRLDRYLRLRTGSTYIDSDLAELRSNLHLLADAYDLNMRF